MGASMFLTTVVLAAVIFARHRAAKECKVDPRPDRDILSLRPSSRPSSF